MSRIDRLIRRAVRREVRRMCMPPVINSGGDIDLVQLVVPAASFPPRPVLIDLNAAPSSMESRAARWGKPG